MMTPTQLTSDASQGFFLTVDGGEGAGKTTTLEFIARWLEEQGIDYVRTREPGGTPFAERIRELLLQASDEKVCDMTELLLVFAARAQHIEQVIKPALAAGKLVLCDRFTDASFAYQGAGRGLDLNALSTLENLVHGDLQPDMTLLLDISVAEGMARAGARGALDRIELEKHDFFERVRQGYLDRAAAHADRFVIIDAAKTIPEVQAQIAQALNTRVSNA
ncbi:dTMP kinase [Parendozoicomonas haliclonae]|uniref:Thymidylate kinase n=1 Tax=Parendozoicomonas haliclonae TaxID=1960125 RepID=A0A1X7AMF2_9GAMM|nr:dTMP kinase [Parendozoicomonas haliclonae]SMA49153.1 Thymidylate kinase [Parendozoicomonas haliclonae]